jgi:hypothetical protein
MQGAARWGMVHFLQDTLDLHLSGSLDEKLPRGSDDLIQRLGKLRVGGLVIIKLGLMQGPSWHRNAPR